MTDMTDTKSAHHWDCWRSESPEHVACTGARLAELLVALEVEDYRAAVARIVDFKIKTLDG